MQIPSGPQPTVRQGVSTTRTRDVMVATMVVTRGPGDLFLLCHSGGDDAVCWVEQIDPVSLATKRRSMDLAGGPAWPGGLAAHANGSLYVVFGRHAHRLNSNLDVLATQELPRERPYNSFVVTTDGTLITKDFGGARPGDDVGYLSVDTELLALDPDDLRIASSLVVREPSVARISAYDDDIYVVGTGSLIRVHWSSERRELVLDDSFVAPYRREGEGYGWDCVIADGSAWFLNNGAGSERFDGSLRGKGVAKAAQAVVRIRLDSGAVARYEICEGPGGIVANPPAVDALRGIVVGYDTGHGVIGAWRYRGVEPVKLWRRDLNHGGHPMMLPDHGAVIVFDLDTSRTSEDVVVLDVESGEEICRAPTGSPVQSVLFPAVGFDNDIYYCSFLAVSRIQFERPT